MIVLKATGYMKEKLHGYKNGNSVLFFVKDGSGNWVTAKENLENKDFKDILPSLQKMKEVVYTAPINEKENYF